MTAASTDPVAPARGAVLGPLTSIAVAVALSSAVTFASVVAYDHFAASRPRPVATVSLQAALDAKEVLFAELIGKPGATDSDRRQALAGVEQIGRQLEKAVAELRDECACLLLVREAVVGRADMDLTARLLEKMGLAHVDVVAARARTRAAESISEPAGTPPVARGSRP